MSIQVNVVKDLMRWIEQNLENRLVIDEVSLRSGFSKWHLQRIFTEVTGVPIGQYVRQRRLKLAADELLSTHDSISDIAIKFGFANQQAFTRTFKRHYDLPPAKWRSVQNSTIGNSLTLN